MQDRLPIPTDNIFKFYALFGLLLFVFASASSVYLVRSGNEFMATAVVEIETLKSIQNPGAGQIARRQVLERLVTVERSDRKFFDWVLSGIAVLGAILMTFGFTKWHVYVQPRQDELLDLQIRQLKHSLRRVPQR